MKIGVIGAGRLGLSFALLCERAGYCVYISDKRKEYITSITKQELKTNEPEVLKLFKKVKNLKASTNNQEVIKNCDVIFLFVNTPSLSDGSYDVSAIWEVVKELRETNDSKQLIIGSTVNPKDCSKFKEELKSNIQLFYVPVFIAQGSIIKDMITNNNILVGTNESNVTILNKLYSNLLIKKPNFTVMSTTAAEITKIAANSFVTAKISYANMIGDTLYKSFCGEDINKCLSFIGELTETGSKFFNYGFGYGGPCLPRDNKALSTYIKSIELDYELCSELDKANKAHANFLKKHYEKSGATKFFIRSVAYKNDTDIITDSQQLKLAIDLLEAGHTVYIGKDDKVYPQIKDRLKNKFGKKVQFVTEITNIKDRVITIEL